MPTRALRGSRAFLAFIRPRTTSSWILRLGIISLASIFFFIRYSPLKDLPLSEYLRLKSSKHAASDLGSILVNGAGDAILPSERPSPPSSPRNSSRILLVSALFPLVKSKHSVEEYKSWLANFLQPITTPIYFYTTPGFAPIIQDTRGADLPIIINTTYASPFDIPPLRGLEETYAEMHDLDREKSRHSPELYAVWNAKPFFLDAAVKALEAEGDVYEYAFWNDAGSFRREHTYTLWPDPLTVHRVWKTATLVNGKKEDDFLFFPIAALPPGDVRNWKEDTGPVDYDISEGSFFGGSPKTISWWSQTYYTYHNYYLSRSLFVGKDQTLINALSLLFPSRILTVFYSDPGAPQFPDHIPFFDAGYLGACGSEWFYYQYWLAGYEERKNMAEVWTKESRWAGWNWWRKRQECRLAKVENWDDLVRRAFGKDWSPPERKVIVNPDGVRHEDQVHGRRLTADGRL